MLDMRQLENKVTDELQRRGFPSSRLEGRKTNVQSGFVTTIEGPHVLSVAWKARYDYVLRPNEAREKHQEVAAALTTAGFNIQTSPGSTEVTVRRDPV
jgi:hypothetical protein